MEIQKQTINDEKLRDSFIRSCFNIEKFEKNTNHEKTPHHNVGFTQDHAFTFKERLTKMLEPSLPAKELIGVIIKCALEVEFGKSYILTKGFDKITSKIADSIMSNPTLRRQILSVTSIILENRTKKHVLN